MPPLRLRSLGAFRGLTIAAMVLVNNPGTWMAVYAPLKHARWHGLTPTDVTFPFFLFIVGVAIPLSQPRPGRGAPPRGGDLRPGHRARRAHRLRLGHHPHSRRPSEDLAVLPDSG